MTELEKNIIAIKRRIEVACINANRNTNSVKLLLATKTVNANKIIEAINLGETLIGENKIQEVKEKFEALKNIPYQKHFIGYLQSNKIKDILKYEVNCIQSLDRLSLAEKLHKRLTLEEKKLDELQNRKKSIL